MRRQRWTPGDDAKVKAMAAEFMTYAQMSERMGRTAESIRTRYLRHLRTDLTAHCSITGRPPRTPWSSAESAQAFELHKQGWSQRAIANKLGRNKSNVQVHIRKHQEPEILERLKKRREIHFKDRLRIQRELDQRYGLGESESKAEVAALAERDVRRQLEPRDLTARFCGDPLPGYSALERRNNS